MALCFHLLCVRWYVVFLHCLCFGFILSVIFLLVCASVCLTCWLFCMTVRQWRCHISRTWSWCDVYDRGMLSSGRAGWACCNSLCSGLVYVVAVWLIEIAVGWFEENCLFAGKTSLLIEIAKGWFEENCFYRKNLFIDWDCCRLDWGKLLLQENLFEIGIVVGWIEENFFCRKISLRLP